MWLECDDDEKSFDTTAVMAALALGSKQTQRERHILTDHPPGLAWVLDSCRSDQMID